LQKASVALSGQEPGLSAAAIAHVRESDGCVQDLCSHLQGTACRARQFAARFGAGEWGRLTGLWHDRGKLSPAFRRHIISASGLDAAATCETLPGKVDHSSAGAQHAVAVLPVIGHLLAFVIAGHHSGLLDAVGTGASLKDRLDKPLPPLPATDDDPPVPPPDLPPFVKRHIAARDGFGVAFFTRMIFSCLCDADFLDTEAFMRPVDHAQRAAPPADVLRRMTAALDAHTRTLRAAGGRIDHIRAQVRRMCIDKSPAPPGFFSLTVPTGGGKTLSSLAFALRHALRHDLDRIVYVVPFTTIIEQNAARFREALAGIGKSLLDRTLVEHHSSFDPVKETPSARLACENWDAVLIVTTSVQFYESLFASRPSACRKLHNLARAVIILDEAQAIPVDYLHPCIRALRELVAGYGATVVFCTATQPAIHSRDEFPIGIAKEEITEIVADRAALYRRLRRVETSLLGTQDDAELAAHMRSEKQALCIVKTTGHAARLFQELGPDDSCFHLSARMCPAHRCKTLRDVTARLHDGLPCRVVSTTLVEAGVDIDFPVVFRAVAGIDAIVQAAGRCNRAGRLARGRLHIFEPGREEDRRFLAEESDCGRQILALYPRDPLALEAIDHYFRLHFWERRPRWDRHAILDSFRLDQNPALPFLFDFASVAARFKLIPDDTLPVVVPYGEEGERLCNELRRLPLLTREHARRAQRFTVGVRRKSWLEVRGKLTEPLFGDSLALLLSPQLNYSDSWGLHLDWPAGEAFLL
jgi:CRISPR-associated endonuclease/helicase Cas3